MPNRPTSRPDPEERTAPDADGPDTSPETPDFSGSSTAREDHGGPDMQPAYPPGQDPS